MNKQIDDDDSGIPTDLLSIPLHYRDDLENVLIPYGLILDRTEAIATRNIIICILNNSSQFLLLLLLYYRNFQ